MDLIRTFIALEMPAEIERELAKISADLKGVFIDLPLRWVVVPSIHLTLKFLGNIPESDVQKISAVIDRQAKSFPLIEMQLSGLGVFPDLRKPNVLWVGVDAGEELRHLQRAVEGDLQAMGYPAENRKFNPHLTIARVKRSATPAELKHIGELVASQPPPASALAIVEALTLFRSQQERGASVYNPLFRAAMAGAI